jgi:LysM repeat protein
VYSTVKKRIQVKLIVDPDESITELESTPDSTDQYETTLQSEHISHTAECVKKVDTTDSLEEDVKKVVLDPTAKTKSNSDFIYHTVQPGDTLWNIAQRYRSDLKTIKKINKIGKSNDIRSGTRLKIPVNGG